MARGHVFPAVYRPGINLTARPPARSHSQNAQHLRPYRQGGQKQAKRSQSERLLDNSANHLSSPRLERKRNIVPLLFQSQEVGIIPLQQVTVAPEDYGVFGSGPVSAPNLAFWGRHL